jgi:hypothetical protein
MPIAALITADHRGDVRDGQPHKGPMGGPTSTTPAPLW